MSREAITVIRAEALVSRSAQTQNLTQKTGVEVPKLWMGRVTCEPGQDSGAHHQGEAETASYVLSGNTRIYYGERYEEYVDLGPGDFVYVPPFVPHIEKNMSDAEPVVFITAESRENKQASVNHPSNREIKVVRSSELDSATSQTTNLPMSKGIEAPHLWMGRATGTPGKDSGAHHHGEAETGVYVMSGHTRIFYGEGFKEYVELGPGDFMHVPPFLPHIERNISNTEPVEFVAVRNPKNIVVNIEGKLE